MTSHTTPNSIHSRETPTLEELQRLRIQAKTEIGEKDELIPQKILEVRELISMDKTINVPPKMFDQFLLRCLRARKYDVKRAAKTYKKFCHLHKLEDVANFMKPSTNNDLIKGKFVSLLSKRDSHGRQIVFVQLKNWNPSKHTLDESLACLFMFLEQATESLDTQLHGVVALADFKGFGFSHLRQITPTKIQLGLSVVQDAYPARFKEFHIFNHPTIFNMVFALAKPFLKEKIKNRIFLHADDLSSVQRSISPSNLPKFLGGKLPDNQCYDEESTNALMLKDQYFSLMRENFVVLDRNNPNSDLHEDDHDECD